MARFFIFVLPLLAAFSTVAAPQKRTITDVQIDIAQITSQVATLITLVNTFPISGGGSAQVMPIHNLATTLVGTINKGTTDVNNLSTPSELDSQIIFNSLQNLATSIITGLAILSAKKVIVQALPPVIGTMLVQQDLSSLNTAAINFENACIAKAPADFRVQGQALVDSVNNAFHNAIAAFA
ncbi:hypothetical protein L218DRAFT_1009647 [Marasmius fiardii PR-910]|nr:hypothetical protein L218DRAFT_1009647 [Marasmius fiardii PR-910]